MAEERHLDREEQQILHKALRSSVTVIGTAYTPEDIADIKRQAIDDCIKAAKEELSAADLRYHTTPSDALVNLQIADAERRSLKRAIARLEAMRTGGE